ncbi:Plasma membrane proteolipid 3, partial [Diplodia seriata]
DLILYIAAIFLPPLVVLAKTGCGGVFCLNVILTLLGWIPGVIRKSHHLSAHTILETDRYSEDAWIVVATSPRRRVVYRRTAVTPAPAHYHRRTYASHPAPRRRHHHRY